MPELPDAAGTVARLVRPLELVAPTEPPVTDSAAAAAQRKRPRPGERRVQILQTLAAMLERPGSERITTAALAARLEVSEAALYRHFASKAQMFEGLIEFIETSVFSLVNQITDGEAGGSVQARRIVVMLLQFGEKNPGMARVMVGDALVFEHERLSLRMNQFFDRVEGQLRQCLRRAAGPADAPTGVTALHAPNAPLQPSGPPDTTAPSQVAHAMASGLTALVIGRLQRFSRSGFRRSPTDHLDELLSRLTP